MVCFVHFDLKMYFAPQQCANFNFSSGHTAPHPPLQRAYFSTLQTDKWLEKHNALRLYYLLSSNSFSSLSSTLLFSDFSSLHIVGNLTSILPLIILYVPTHTRGLVNTMCILCDVLPPGGMAPALWWLLQAWSFANDFFHDLVELSVCLDDSVEHPSNFQESMRIAFDAFGLFLFRSSFTWRVPCVRCKKWILDVAICCVIAAVHCHFFLL